MTPELITFLEEQGYRNLREVPGKGICGVMDMLFTVGLFCGLTADFYAYRYCYPKEFPGAAEMYLAEWDGIENPGGPWIKCKGRRQDILNPYYDLMVLDYLSKK